MKIIELLKIPGRGISFEFFPPKNDKAKTRLKNTIEVLKEYKPLYASMTYGAGGKEQENTKEAVDMLLKQKSLVVMPHLTCIGSRKENLKKLLDEYNNKGIQNIMALRGDLPEDDCFQGFLEGDLCYAMDLVKLIKSDYPDLCVGVAVYPEGHIETASLDEDMEHTKKKIDEGAEFAVTQMFFDNKYYYGLIDRMKKNNMNIPVLPGVLPLTNLKTLRRFVSLCRTTIPKNIEDALIKVENDAPEMQKIGVGFTINQCRDLIKNGFTKLHFFTLNMPDVIKTILEAIK